MKIAFQSLDKDVHGIGFDSNCLNFSQNFNLPKNTKARDITRYFYIDLCSGIVSADKGINENYDQDITEQELKNKTFIVTTFSNYEFVQDRLDFIIKYHNSLNDNQKNFKPHFNVINELEFISISVSAKFEDVVFKNGLPSYPLKYFGKDEQEANWNIKNYLGTDNFKVEDGIVALQQKGLQTPNLYKKLENMHEAWKTTKETTEKITRLKETLNEQMELAPIPHPYKAKGFVKE